MSDAAREAVFFYGSFMDPAVLGERGVVAGDGRIARLKGWQLAFTPAPTLVRSFCGVVWGLVHELSAEERRRLYAQPLYGRRYAPTEVTAAIGGRPANALAYVVADAEPAGVAEPESVERVKRAARLAGLPAAYVDSLGKAPAP